MGEQEGFRRPLQGTLASKSMASKSMASKSMGKWARKWAGVVLVGSLAGATLVNVPTAFAAADPTVYSDALGAGWQDWSWGSTVDTNSASPVNVGSRALSARINQSFGGLSLRSSQAIALEGGNITLAMHGGASGSTVNFYTGTDDYNSQISVGVSLAAPANTWVRHTVTAQQLGNPAQISRLNLQSAQPTAFSLDDVRVNPGSVATTAPATTTPTTLPQSSEGSISIDAGNTQPFSNRMWGTNLAFYNGGWGFNDATLRARAKGMTGLTRFPGTQDGQRWGWASCQVGFNIPNAQTCTNPDYTWTAKASDFISFVQATGNEGLITLNANATAKENAAFVAFVNGSTADTRSIGVDQRGADWRTVGYWAQLRANLGLAPLGVKLWEFGNETYGGIGANGCVAYGWEVTWTCKAAEFLDGIGSGAARQDGYRATKAALKAVDSSIQVGVPAERGLDDYNSWTRELIQNSRGDVDFLSVHPYFRWIPPADTPAGNAEILAFPQTHWKGIADEMNRGFAQYGVPRIPMVISEYNLTPGPQNDPSRRMNGMGNAIMMSDSVGTMASLNGAYIASNALELYQTPSPDGTYYAMIRRDGNFTRNPLYYGWVMWSRFGQSLAQTTSTFDASNTLSVYGGRKDANTVTLYVFNKSGRNVSARVNVNGIAGISSVLTDAAVGQSLYDGNVTFNGQSNPNNDLSNAPGSTRSIGATSFVQTFQPWSMTLLTMTLGTATVTTQPVTTQPVTTQPVTTQPVTTQPVTTQPVTTVAGVAGCKVTFVKAWQGDASFGVDGTITNTGSLPISNWSLAFAFAGNQKVDLSWGSRFAQSGQNVTMSDAGWNGTIAPGSTATFGFRAQFTGANAPIARSTLNGQTCS
jgi:hypothetical protein